jgi:hypothetical protein
MLRTVFVESVSRRGFYDQVVRRHIDPSVLRLQADGPDLPADVREERPAEPDRMRPPHRLVLIETPGGAVFCRLQINHGLIDGASVSILFAELALAYAGQLPGGPGPLYSDYVAFVQGLPAEAARRYWMTYLAGVEPCCFPRLNDAGSGGRELRTLRLDTAGLLAEVSAFCRAADVTVANVVQTAWALVLRAYTGGEEVCFGYLASGRDVPVAGVDAAVGPFINMLVARLHMPATAVAGELVKAMQDAHIEGLPYQHYPLAEIQHELGVKGTALFNTVMSLQTYRPEVQTRLSGTIFRSIGGYDPTEVSALATLLSPYARDGRGGSLGCALPKAT